MSSWRAKNKTLVSWPAFFWSGARRPVGLCVLSAKPAEEKKFLSRGGPPIGFGISPEGLTADASVRQWEFITVNHGSGTLGSPITHRWAGPLFFIFLPSLSHPGGGYKKVALEPAAKHEAPRVIEVPIRASQHYNLRFPLHAALKKHHS